MGLLSRPGDKPSDSEEENISRYHKDRQKRLDNVLFRLRISSMRSRTYVAEGDGKSRDLFLERIAQDRMLDELLRVQKR